MFSAPFRFENVARSYIGDRCPQLEQSRLRFARSTAKREPAPSSLRTLPFTFAAPARNVNKKHRLIRKLCRTDDVAPPVFVVAPRVVGAEVDAARLGALERRPDHQPRHRQQVLQLPPRAV